MPPNPARVFVTGMGTVNCTGSDAARLWKSSLQGERMIHDGFGVISSDLLLSLQNFLVDYLPKSTSDSVRRLFSNPESSKFTIITLYALCQAISAAGWSRLGEGDSIFFATTTGQVPLWENPLMDYLEGKIASAEFAKPFSQEPLGLALNSALSLLNASGVRTHLISSACSASTQAMALAYFSLQSQQSKRCLAGGTELLCQLTREGFKSLQLLSANPSTPFDQNRSGINLSEASAFICLETDPAQKSDLVLSGAGMANDGYHMTSPHPEGLGILQSMRGALNSANLKAEAVSWVHAHGTGSKANDEAEVAAIRSLFEPHPPMVSSTKPVHGHALAVSGVLESVVSLQSIVHGQIPPTAGLKDPEWSAGCVFPTGAQNQPVNHVLKNSLGFGGANASVVFSRA